MGFQTSDLWTGWQPEFCCRSSGRNGRLSTGIPQWTSTYGTCIFATPGVTSFPQSAIPDGANAAIFVNASDANSAFNQLNTIGYSAADINLSGIITATDANIVFDNLGRSSQVPSNVSDSPVDAKDKTGGWR